MAAVCSKVNDPAFIAKCGPQYATVEERNTLFKSLAARHSEVMGFLHTLSTKNPTEQLQYMTQFGPSLYGFNILKERYIQDSKQGIGAEAAIMEYLASHKADLEKMNWTSKVGPFVLSTEEQKALEAARKNIETQWAPRAR